MYIFFKLKALKGIKNAYCSFLHWLLALRRPCPLHHLTVLEVSTERQWSEWWLSWKVRWNWFFSPWCILAALRLETSANLFWESRIILEMFTPFFSLHFPPLSLSLALTGPMVLPRLVEQGKPNRDWFNWAQLLHEMAFSNPEWSLLMIH